jgi:hypothetical protein
MFKLFALLVLLLPVVSATTASVQVQSVTGGFLAACGSYGCGGKFQGMENGTVAPSGAMVNGTDVFLYCVDFENDVYIPSQVYTANITPITNGSNLSNTVYGRTSSAWAPGDQALPINFTVNSFTDTTGSFTPASGLQRYQMAAWLISQYSALNADKNAIQDAIWTALEVTPPSGETGPKFPAITGKTKTDMNLLLSEAADYVSAPDTSAKEDFFSEFKVVTQIAPIYLHSPNQIQEFMIINPEPAAMAILVAGIFGVLAWMKLRRRIA